MKLHMDPIFNSIFTLADTEAIKTVRDGFKEQKDLKWEAEALLHLASNGADLLKVEHTIAINKRTYNRFGTDAVPSNYVDIRITATGYDKWEDAFYEVSGFVSDAWDINSDNHDEVRSRLYVKRYALSK